MTTAPITLYLDLEPGQVADLEVVARASLAFAAAVKDLAYIIDPSLDLRIELESGTEGSLGLNNRLRNLKEKAGETFTLAAVIGGVMGWFGGEVAHYGFEKLMEHITGEDHRGFTPEQRKEFEEMLRKSREGKVAEQHVHRIYQELDRDPMIRGVGATQVQGERPAVIVPRSEFAARAGRAAPREETINRRVRVEDVQVLLISPVLLPGNRRWKLKSAQGEFGAAIKDADFINRVLAGTTNVRMKAGIEMSVELETAEEFRHGVWEVVERNVLHVNGLVEPPAQGDLLLPEGDDGEADESGN
jgi:hypothetical protein